MRLDNPAPKRVKISLTPLIDVVFLLLIFFMLASTFLKFSGTEVSGAASGGTATSAKELALVQIRTGGQLAVNGRAVSIDQLDAQLNALSTQGVSRGVVRPLPGSTVQDLVTVLEIARGTSLKSVVVVK
ncbi:MAG: biopolymer transporter ExbD [Pseudomonadota bacterium]